MRVDVTWTACGATAQRSYGERPCAICEEGFWLGPVAAQAVSDSGVLLGEVCPACLLAGPEHMRGELELRAAWSRLQADQDEEIASEPFGDCPTLDEFLALEAALGGSPSPLRATVEEAERASTPEPGCTCPLAGRKESLVEKRRYVGGVAAEDRSAEELRFEELGLEEFFWGFVRLQSRVEDLEERLAEPERKPAR